jgi:hypothetical protein
LGFGAIFALPVSALVLTLCWQQGINYWLKVLYIILLSGVLFSGFLSFLEFADIRSLVFKNPGMVNEGQKRWTTVIRRLPENAIAAIRTRISLRTPGKANLANQETAKSIPLPGAMAKPANKWYASIVRFWTAKRTP